MERFRAGTTWQALEVTSEPYIILTARGYAAAVTARELTNGTEYEMMISGIESLAQAIEPLKAANSGLFSGLRFRVRKETADLMSPYLVDSQGVEGYNLQRAPCPSEGVIITSNEDKLWHRIWKGYGL